MERCVLEYFIFLELYVFNAIIKDDQSEEHIFITLYTNLHFIFFQLNLNTIQITWI
jgi:hypothetical protein